MWAVMTFLVILSSTMAANSASLSSWMGTPPEVLNMLKERKDSGNPIVFNRKLPVSAWAFCRDFETTVDGTEALVTKPCTDKLIEQAKVMNCSTEPFLNDVKMSSYLLFVSCSATAICVEAANE